MIQHVWTVPCRVSITDQETNNLSMIEILEELSLPPLTPLRESGRQLIPVIFDVVSLWTRENSEPEIGQGKVSLVSPQGETVVEQEVEVDLREVQRLRTFGKFFGLPVREPGVYHFVIARRPNDTAEWQEVARIPLEVRIESGLEQSGASGKASGAA